MLYTKAIILYLTSSSMIQVTNLSLAYGERTIFDKISCVVGTNHVGLVGRNGAGKSTLLKIIAGLIKPDEGSISIERDKKIAYMPQEVVLASTKSVFDEAFSVFNEYLLLQQECVVLEDALAQAPDNAEELLERYEQLHLKLATFDESAARARTERILTGLGFDAIRQTVCVDTLSVGWKMRIVLAQLLLQDADFYLFDEPTNHLDIVAQEWFADFLKSADFGFLLVTHDRYFLDYVCTEILALDNGNAKWYRGNFSAYLMQKEQQNAAQQTAYDRQQREVERKKETIERFRASATKSSMAQSMIKQLDKVELIQKPEAEMPTITIRFPEPQRAGQNVLTIQNVAQQFSGKTLFENVNCIITRGQKVALIAANGVGKTTLFNLITGALPLQKGSIEMGHNVQWSVFEQDQTRVLKPNNTVYSEVVQAAPKVTEAAIRSFLGAFLFSGDDIYKKISMLSGGERNRVAMVKVLLQNANFLLLDEPTNHLDLYAKQVLLQALQQYAGTLFFVSHDHDFINKLATHIIELTPHGLESYEGSYESYLQFKQQRSAHLKPEFAPQKAKPTVVKTEAPAPTGSNKKSAQLHREVKALEAKMERVEQNIALSMQTFERLTYGTHEFNEMTAKMKKLKEEQKMLSLQWEELYNSVH
jgi:ATP-binding cassette subfamily F protein 3